MGAGISVLSGAMRPLELRGSSLDHARMEAPDQDRDVQGERGVCRARLSDGAQSQVVQRGMREPHEGGIPGMEEAELHRARGRRDPARSTTRRTRRFRRWATRWWPWPTRSWKARGWRLLLQHDRLGLDREMEYLFGGRRRWAGAADLRHSGDSGTVGRVIRP